MKTEEFKNRTCQQADIADFINFYNLYIYIYVLESIYHSDDSKVGMRMPCHLPQHVRDSSIIINLVRSPKQKPSP